jgi:hypothetical protein
MDPRMNDVKEYAAYIHSYNQWNEPKTEYKAAILSLQRRGTLFEDVDYINEAKTIIKSIFGNNKEYGALESTGLKVRYYDLVNIIKKQKPYGIAIILAMATNESSDEHFTTYLPCGETTPINLTFCGIARRVLDEYMKKTEIENLCKRMPNYEGILRNLRTAKERQGKRTPRETPLHCGH